MTIAHRRLQSGGPVQPRQIQEAYLAAWGRELELAQVVASGDRSLDESRDLGLALVDVYLKEEPPEHILAVEQPMLSPIANSRGDYLEKPILVVADLITRREDGTLQVGELKTAGRAYSDSEVATSLQPTFYANALYETSGQEPAVEYTILVKTKVPRVQRIEAVRTTGDYRRLGDLIDAVELGVQAGVFYPVESPMNCAGCSYYRQCREWTGNNVQAGATRTRVGEVVPC